jgi:hypothetical protein
MVKVCSMLLTLTLALLGGVPLSAQEHIWGTSSAALSNDPGFEGYWKYCFEISWDVTGYDGYGVSHIDILLGLELCPCVCFDGYFAFADTVGSGPGTTNGSGCTVYWYGYFECEGDPTVPDGGPDTGWMLHRCARHKIRALFREGRSGRGTTNLRLGLQRHERLYVGADQGSVPLGPRVPVSSQPAGQKRVLRRLEARNVRPGRFLIQTETQRSGPPSDIPLSAEPLCD